MDTENAAEFDDKLISLSTCEYSRNNGRLIVVAKKISENAGKINIKNTFLTSLYGGKCTFLDV